MARNVRTNSPSGLEVSLFGMDSYTSLREYCTCPNCRAVWLHTETGNLRKDWQYASANYSQEVQCMECGMITEAIPKPTIWQQMRSQRRRTVDHPLVPPDLSIPHHEREYDEEER